MILAHMIPGSAGTTENINYSQPVASEVRALLGSNPSAVAMPLTITDPETNPYAPAAENSIRTSSTTESILLMASMR